MKQSKSPSSLPNVFNILDIEIKKITDWITTQYAIDKIICFGSTVNSTQEKSSFSRNKEDSIKSLTLNSYCILIIPVADEKSADIVIQQRSEENCKTIANLTVIVHRMEEINNALQNGSSFFTTVYKKGELIYDNLQEFFVTPSPGRDINKRILQKELFWQQWHQLSYNFLDGAKFYAKNQNNNLAVFMLHQTLQHCYSAMLRVLTGYKTNSNSLRRLLKLIDNALPGSSFLSCYKNTPEEARLIALLLKGFSDARYKPSLEVTGQDVADLIERTLNILGMANMMCLTRIKDIKEGKLPYVA